MAAHRSVVLVVASLLVAGACDDTFSPIEQSELRRSIVGYLDAGAYTQWVRILPEGR